VADVATPGGYAASAGCGTELTGIDVSLYSSLEGILAGLSYRKAVVSRWCLRRLLGDFTRNGGSHHGFGVMPMLFCLRARHSGGDCTQIWPCRSSPWRVRWCGRRVQSSPSDGRRYVQGKHGSSRYARWPQRRRRWQYGLRLASPSFQNI